MDGWIDGPNTYIHTYLQDFSLPRNLGTFFFFFLLPIPYYGEEEGEQPNQQRTPFNF
jgi:hypothetical protein